METIDDVKQFTVAVMGEPPIPFVKKWTAITGVAMNVTPVCVDINNDGIKEIFIAGNNGTSNTGRIVSVNGIDGSILWAQEWATPYQDAQTPMAIGDLAGDGVYRIVHTASNRTMARNCSDGSIFWDVPVPSGWHHLAIVDNNGSPYVFVSMHGAVGGSQRISKLRGIDGSIVAQAPVHYPCYGGISIADINNDGKNEILINDGSLRCFDEDLNQMWVHSADGESACPILADVNGDGYLDVIAVNGVSQTNGGLMVVSGKDGTIMKNLPNQALPTHMTPTVYDIDKDGNPEFITAYGGRIKVFDLVTEQIEAELNHNGYYYRATHAPCIGKVMPGQDLQIILDGSWDGAISIWDKNYQRVATVPGWGTNILVDDIDGDGYNEILVTTWYNGIGTITCYSTAARTNNARTDTNYYGERRTGAEVFYPKV